ncbi:MAG: hypothetical protein QMD85_04465, partial [Candidatus Aenigmarchaeota archaeon]|nr:hypothetical protein [Candidatus Aenigmarchaeota archaeon]
MNYARFSHEPAYERFMHIAGISRRCAENHWSGSCGLDAEACRQSSYLLGIEDANPFIESE